MFELSDCRFRRARLADLVGVGRLEKLVWGDLAAPPSELRRRFYLFPEAFQVAVAWRTDVVGFCCGFLTPLDAGETDLSEQFPPQHVPRAPFMFLVGLTVSPVFRRRGVAAELIDRELAVARRLRCRKVQLVANAVSRGLFHKKGFQVVRELPLLFQNHRDLMLDPVLMERTVQP